MWTGTERGGDLGPCSSSEPRVASVQSRCTASRICSLTTAGLPCRVESHYIGSLLLDPPNLNLTRRVHDGLLSASRPHFATL